MLVLNVCGQEAVRDSMERQCRKRSSLPMQKSLYVLFALFKYSNQSIHRFSSKLSHRKHRLSYDFFTADVHKTIVALVSSLNGSFETLHLAP
uniref:Ovule protein n=1 Tax=Ascaris lumbricoides TaxID=6252 RepID=A0A0M3HJM5_ASCLU